MMTSDLRKVHVCVLTSGFLVTSFCRKLNVDLDSWTQDKKQLSTRMWLTLALVIVLSVFDRSFTQAPDDADPFCTVTLPGIGFNILDYAPEVKPLMDSRHYQNLLPPHMNPVWQEVDNDNNNPSGLTTDVSWVEI